MLEAIVVGVIVGAFGGFLGAAIGPFLGHKFSARQRRQIRAERRREYLRGMLERRIADSRRYRAASLSIPTRIRSLNKTPTESFQEFLSKELDAVRSGDPWQPYRIDDEDLRGSADQFNDLTNELFNHLGEIVTVAPDAWEAETKKKVKALSDLARVIELRLDELDW